MSALINFYSNDGRLLENEKIAIEVKGEVTIKTKLPNGTYQIKLIYDDNTFDVHSIIINK